MSDEGPSPTTIRPARAAEAALISALAIRSKAHWDYTPEELAVFREELTLAPDQVEPDRIHVAAAGGELQGFYSLVEIDETTADLDHLFIDPRLIGRGIGRALLAHACETARLAGYTELFVLSDPNAAGFYRALGWRFVEDLPSSIPGRSLPRFALTLVGDGG